MTYCRVLTWFLYMKKEVCCFFVRLGIILKWFDFWSSNFLREMERGLAIESVKLGYFGFWGGGFFKTIRKSIEF